jgi:hypothetical protein
MFIKGPGKKKSRTDFYRSGNVPFLSSRSVLAPLSTEVQYYKISGRFSDFRIILLTAPSHPGSTGSDMLRFSSPVTAAGPSPICTEFPLMLTTEHLKVNYLLNYLRLVKTHSFYQLKPSIILPINPCIRNHHALQFHPHRYLLCS